MMVFFKNLIKHKTTYYKNYYYRNSFLSYNFKDRFDLFKNIETYKTTQSILFKGKVPFDINLSTVVKILGRPHFVHNEESINQYLTIYYKNKLNNIKNKSQLHFFDNQFFYGIQIFPYLTKSQQEEFSELLRIKYQYPSNVNYPIALIDHQQSLLMISVNFGLTLEYITGNTLLVEHVIQALKQLEMNNLTKDKKRRQLIMNSI